MAKLTFIENAGDKMRYIGFADEIAKIGHTGWFIDEFQDEKFRGVVYKLRNGMYGVGYAEPWNNGDVLEFGRFDDAREAARAADHIAEREAEKEREYQEGWQAGNRYAEYLPEAIRDTRKRFLTLAKAQPSLDRDAANTRWLAEIAQVWVDLRRERAELLSTWGRHEGFKESAGL